MPLEHAVPELVGQPFIFKLREVMRTELNCAATGMPAQLEIDHQLQTSYDDYEYRALKNESGEVYCMLHTATDVTEKDLGEEAVAHEQEHLHNIANEQALNEELIAANEELGAVNEELPQTQE